MAPLFLDPATPLLAPLVLLGAAYLTPSLSEFLLCGQDKVTSCPSREETGQHAARVWEDIKALSVTFWDTNSYLPFTACLCSYIYCISTEGKKNGSYTYNIIWLLKLNINLAWARMYCLTLSVTPPIVSFNSWLDKNSSIKSEIHFQTFNQRKKTKQRDLNEDKWTPH